MASQQCLEKPPTIEEVYSAYNDLLTKVNKCLLLCESLEMNRTYKEIAMDWLDGHRQINMKRLREEIEYGLGLIKLLIRKINGTGLVDMTRLEYLLSRILKYLQDVHIFPDARLRRSPMKISPRWRNW